MSEFTVSLMQSDESGKIKKVGEKVLYNMDEKESTAEWLRKDSPKGIKYVGPRLTSALKIARR